MPSAELRAPTQLLEFAMRNPAFAVVLSIAVAVFTGNFAQAKDSFDSPSVSERLESAHKAIRAKDWKVAMTQLQAAVRDEPRNPDVHNLIGYTYRMQQNPDLTKSFEHYNTALKYNPNHKGTLEYMGEAYLMEKKPEEAEKLLVRLETVCGNQSCAEYQELFKAIADYKLK
jgi:Tfp pilus assembly protein PilF